MDFSALFSPFEQADAWLQGLLSGAPFLVAMAIALALGLRHASDPDHLVAVSSLVAAEGGETRAAARIGGWSGAGPAGALLAIGLPLIFLKSALPTWVEQAAGRAGGVIILLLAPRVRPAAIDTFTTPASPITPTGSERPGRRPASASSTGSPAPARSSCS